MFKILCTATIVLSLLGCNASHSVKPQDEGVRPAKTLPALLDAHGDKQQLSDKYIPDRLPRSGVMFDYSILLEAQSNSIVSPAFSLSGKGFSVILEGEECDGTLLPFIKFTPEKSIFAHARWNQRVSWREPFRFSLTRYKNQYTLRIGNESQVIKLKSPPKDISIKALSGRVTISQWEEK